MREREEGMFRNSAPSSGHRCAHFSPHSFSFTYGLALRLPHALPPGFRPPSFLRHSRLPFLPPLPSCPSLISPHPYFSTRLRLMPVDTVIDLRQRAGDLAPRLGSLSHFMPAAQELLDIVHRLNSEIMLRHNRKVGLETSSPHSRRCLPINPRLRDRHPGGGRYEHFFFRDWLILAAAVRHQLNECPVCVSDCSNDSDSRRVKVALVYVLHPSLAELQGAVFRHPPGAPGAPGSHRRQRES